MATTITSRLPGDVDFTEYMVPSQPFAKDQHLAVAGVGGQPIYTFDGDHEIWDIKGFAGWPWDGFTYDDNFIYQSYTELGWTANTQFKMYASKTWPKANGGIVWAPRWLRAGTLNPPIVTADSTYRTYTSCTEFHLGDGNVPDLGGPVETHVEGEYLIDFKGDLGKRPALVHTFKWGKGYLNMEVNYYTRGYVLGGNYVPGMGRVQWELWQLICGRYVRQKQVAFNSIQLGGVPPLAFPCGRQTLVLP